MLNHIVVMGRLTRDPELRKTASGVSVTSFSVAVDRDFSQDGQKETDFLDVVAWRNTAEFAAKYFAKGRMAVVSGRLQILLMFVKDFFPEVALKKGRTKLTRQIAGSEKMM